MRALLATALSCMALLGACAPPKEKAGAEALPFIRTAPVSAAAALVPRAYSFKTPGTLTIGMTVGALPIADYTPDGQGYVGLDPNFAQLIAESLGLKLKILPIAWPDWPLGLTSGKYDAVMANVTVTEERKDKFDFSTYRDDKLGIYTRSDGPILRVDGPQDVAGRRVALTAGTNQSQILDRWNARNIAAGLKPVEPLYYDDPGVMRLAVLSGRADLSFGPNFLAAYEARDGRTRSVGTVAGGWPLTAFIAVTTRKASGLAPAITAAINAQIDNGNYIKLLRRWNMADERIPRSATNPAGLPRQ